MSIRNLALAAILAAAAVNVAPAPADARPVYSDRGIIVVGGRFGDRMLNPQPLPPRWVRYRYGDRMLNPQPLPPNPCIRCGRFGDRMINPQPLPPRWRYVR